MVFRLTPSLFWGLLLVWGLIAGFFPMPDFFYFFNFNEYIGNSRLLIAGYSLYPAEPSFT